MPTITDAMIREHTCFDCGEEFASLGEKSEHVCFGRTASTVADGRGGWVSSTEHGAPTPRRTVARRNQGRAATAPQVRYVSRLIANADAESLRLLGVTTAPDRMTMVEAARVIDALVDAEANRRRGVAAADNAPATDAAPRRANRFAGNCVRCGAEVDADAGYLTGSRDVGWGVEHLTPADCASTVTEAQAPVYVAAVGEVHLIDGAYYRVARSNRYRNGTRIQRGFVSGDRLSYRSVGSNRASDLRRRMCASTLLTAEQAAAFRHAHGSCVFCARSLTDERSTSVGYGPICAGQRGLPWGDRPSAHAPSTYDERAAEIAGRTMGHDEALRYLHRSECD